MSAPILVAALIGAILVLQGCGSEGDLSSTSVPDTTAAPSGDCTYRVNDTLITLDVGADTACCKWFQDVDAGRPLTARWSDCPQIVFKNSSSGGVKCSGPFCNIQFKGNPWLKIFGPPADCCEWLQEMLQGVLPSSDPDNCAQVEDWCNSEQHHFPGNSTTIAPVPDPGSSTTVVPGNSTTVVPSTTSVAPTDECTYWANESGAYGLKMHVTLNVGADTACCKFMDDIDNVRPGDNDDDADCPQILVENSSIGGAKCSGTSCPWGDSTVVFGYPADCCEWVHNWSSHTPDNCFAVTNICYSSKYNMQLKTADTMTLV